MSETSNVHRGGLLAGSDPAAMWVVFVAANDLVSYET